MPTRRRGLLLGGLAGLCGGRLWAADLPSLVAASRPSVLPVGTYKATDSPRFGFRGTGFVVGDGTLVATNHHVLAEAVGADGPPQMAVLLPRSASEGTVRPARVVASDRWRDLALLQIEGPPLPALPLAEPGTAREGMDVLLIGFPLGGALGFAPVSHRGMVASITTAALPAANARQLDPRALSQLRNGNFEVLQLDATAYPGNSGGPVFDVASGRVVGLVNMVLVKAGRESALSSPTGISYAVPVAGLLDLMRNR